MCWCRALQAGCARWPHEWAVSERGGDSCQGGEEEGTPAGYDRSGPYPPPSIPGRSISILPSMSPSPAPCRAAPSIPFPPFYCRWSARPAFSARWFLGALALCRGLSLSPSCPAAALWLTDAAMSVTSELT